MAAQDFYSAPNIKEGKISHPRKKPHDFTCYLNKFIARKLGIIPSKKKADTNILTIPPIVPPWAGSSEIP
jgi:hypothetical protein